MPIWIIIVIVFAVLILIGCIFGGTKESDEPQSNNNNSLNIKDDKKPVQDNRKKITVIDFSAMAKADIETWCNENGIVCSFTDLYSETVPVGGFISQSVEADKVIYEKDSIRIVYSLGKEPTMGQKNALKKAESYSRNLHMSKSKLYKQLTSEYGEGFTAEEAQYAIDHLVADYNLNALEKAKSYQKNLNMSKSRIYQQLISEYGEGFTASEAQYAIDHLEE